jgi:hypothetical protein
MYTLSKKISFARERLQASMGVGHDSRPHFRPQSVIVFETNEKINDARTRHGADGLILVREVGGERFRGARHGMSVSSYESERLLLNREEFNHFIAYNAACTKDVIM